MITFNQICENIIKILEMNGKFDPKVIKQHLLKYNDNKKKDFIIFLNKITNDPQNDSRELYEYLINLQQDIIVDIELQETSILFNLNKKKYVKEILTTVLTKNEKFGSVDIGKGKKIVLDYSSPNIAKISHVGHFRTTILGNFIKHLLKFNGFEPVSINYLGDWGKQFGLVLLGYEKFGDKKKLQDDALMHLFHVYVKINKHKEFHQEARDIFKAMEEGSNPEYLKQWQLFRDISIEKYKTLYKKLNVEFDVYSGESLYNQKGKKIIEKCTSIVTDEDGSKYINTDYGKALVQKNDGTTLYITRDIAAIIDRMETYNPKQIIYIVSSEQDQHFQQLFYIAEHILKYPKEKFLHVNYGLVKGMSTREGTVHFIDDVIDLATSVFREFVDEKENVLDKEKTALILAISFLIVNDFTAKRIKGYTFDIKKKATTQKGQALGPTLQYTHCRLCGIEEQNAEIVIDNIDKLNFNLVSNDDTVANLMYKLLWFEQVNEQTLLDYEPSRVVFYLQDLCNVINSIINILRVKDTDTEIAQIRLAVFKAAKIVLRNGLKILGLTVLEKM